MTAATAAVESEGVWVDWIKRGIDKIIRARDHHRLAQDANQLREPVVALQQQLDEVAGELELLEAEMSRQGMDPPSLGEYIMHFL